LQFKKKIIVSFVIIFGTLSFPMALCIKPEVHNVSQPGQVRTESQPLQTPALVAFGGQMSSHAAAEAASGRPGLLNVIAERDTTGPGRMEKHERKNERQMPVHRLSTEGCLHGPHGHSSLSRESPHWLGPSRKKSIE